MFPQLFNVLQDKEWHRVRFWTPLISGTFRPCISCSLNRLRHAAHRRSMNAILTWLW